MIQGSELKQQNINTEQTKPIDKSIEGSLDSTKIEQTPEPLVQKSPVDDQAATQVTMPDEQTQIVQTDSEVVHKQVEDILSTGMENTFLSLDAGTQRIFKIKGEETSNKITTLLLQAKVKAKEITRLIFDWLRIIPQINKHYLEQEAKIKTDDILKIRELSIKNKVTK